MSDIWRRLPTLLIARRNLSRTRIRSALATLGIVIGVIAIASLGVFGATLQQAAVGNLGAIGNELIVSPAFEEGVRSISDRDLREIRRVAGDAAVVPVRQSFASVEFGGGMADVTIYGIRNPGATFEARQGRIPDPLRSGAVVGASLADRLDVHVGNSLRVGNETYRVRAVLVQQTGFSPLNPNAAVLLPVDDVERPGYSQVVVTAESGEAANATAVAIRRAVNDRERRVTILELGQITEQIGQFFAALNLFLVGIGSVSLLVAGVSILNVMLMSTIERREEIGVLRAVGYQKLDVLRILLAEALLLGAIGGLIGMAASIGGGLLINHLILGDATAVFTAQNGLYIVAAVGFGVVTSVVSGLYPAYKAANERPVDALRK